VSIRTGTNQILFARAPMKRCLLACRKGINYTVEEKKKMRGKNHEIGK
jgi:hypothetical protein